MKILKLLSVALLGFAVLCVALMLTCCGGAAIRQPAHYADDAARLEYEAAAAVEVECVFPLPDDASPADQLMASLGADRYGSAVAVGPGWAMTARHVVACDLDLPSGASVVGQPASIFLTLYDGRRAEFVVSWQGADAAHDAALLVAVAGLEPFQRWAEVAEDEPRVGDPVCMSPSFPLPMRRCGEWGRRRAGAEWMGDGYVLYSMVGVAGNSGSGVYDAQGRLVALHVAKAEEAAGGGYLAERWRAHVPSASARIDLDAPDWPLDAR